MAHDDLGITSSADPAQKGADEANSDDSTSRPSSEEPELRPPEEDEVLSMAARAAVLEDEVLRQTGPTGKTGQGVQEEQEQESLVTPMITMARAYQLEMCELSMKRNIIAVMDTGSGKTHVSILRMEKELERMSSEKLIWFLAPTVALCEQQFKVISRQIPSVQVKLLSGDDNVDSWSSEAIWTEFLLNVKIVVSTYQILYDALSHAFIRLSRLALIVFDEAHNCVRKHPGRKIMTGLYQEYKQRGHPVPHILGLTASPSMSSTPEDMVALEATLDAICKSPTVHREELLARVKRPTVQFVTYTQADAPGPYPHAFTTLLAAHRGLDIREDPYILHLLSKKTDRSNRELREAVMKKDTFIQDQMWQLVRISRMLFAEIGPWATDYFISGVIDRFTSAMTPNTSGISNWKSKEKEYLAGKLRDVVYRRPGPDELETTVLSDKVMVLLHQLASQAKDTVGIVFAEERIKIPILAHLISTHPLTKDKYNVGSAVGGSSYASRRSDLSELWGQGRDLDGDLEKFRSGKLNLLVATSVLEEGIDVPVCNLVLCFDKPSNPKSFIQRRGRARKKDSKLIILIEASAGLPKDWENLEAKLRKQYEDDEREWARLSRLESEEHSKEFILRGEGGAIIDMDSAKQHLDHFCRVLSPREFVDSRPDYIIRKVGDGDIPSVSAEVILPIFIPPHVRTSKSAEVWKSEKNATKDAAFQAYLALYKEGLLSENLLPFKEDSYRGNIETRLSTIKVSNLMSPWGTVADSWGKQDLSRHPMTLKDERGMVIGEYDMTVPAFVPPPSRIMIYPDSQGPWVVDIGPPVRSTGIEADHTRTLLSMVFGHRQGHFNEQKQHMVSFAARDDVLAWEQIGGADLSQTSEEERRMFLIRDSSSHPFVYDGILPQKPQLDQVRRPFYEFDQAPSNVPYVNLTKWSRRTDLLHPLPGTEQEVSTKPYQYVLEASSAKVDKIPMRHAHFGKLIPCIMHELEVQLLAATVSDTLLREVQISDIELIRAAISPRSSCEPLNYERIELLGDSVLKAVAAVNVSALYPKHPEGYLSFHRDMRVSNAYLSRACVERGLDKFILDKPFTGRKWHPLFVDEVIARAGKEETTGKRSMATKTLADVVEALIGAAYDNGGVLKAVACISTLLPDYEWVSFGKGREVLYDTASLDIPLPPTLAPVEDLVGYSFRKKVLLIEAMTHASYVGTPFGSLERLEFLGDAILDYIIVTKLFEYSPALPHWDIHRLKTAMVNGDFQAFLVMETCARQEATEVTKDLRIERSEFEQPLWAFMMHSSPVIGIEQGIGRQRHAALRGDILAAFESSPNYPWALLSRLRARKFYSDLFESLIGAIWTDSGSIEACEALLERFGLLGFLRRILRDGVHVTHPKEELGQLAGDRKVRYDIDMWLDDDGEKVFTCQVFVGEELKADVKDGVDKEEVKTKAAEVAVRAMKGEPSNGDAMDLT
ncbi:related to Dcl-2 dicer RNA helicase/RNAseIII CAF [Cephalotrichum gorgonifer]|uniref:Related to Dcl-2 dicer RNA helicase/RNAseIII CAF n=1 Tax=Cephalotrichum gorgonifer TaxID=2041049 RepID=A0AAE8SWZ4_9PEZI|nr:related to Dcl-2 dicer RNA helicase/RNAseIII CAF [Cephalotrichum gorgonifer]